MDWKKKFAVYISDQGLMLCVCVYLCMCSIKKLMRKIILKMCRRLEQALSIRGSQNGQYACKKVLNIICQWEIYIKTIMRYCYTPSRITKIKKMDSSSVGKSVDQLDLLRIVGGGVKWYSHFGRLWLCLPLAMIKRLHSFLGILKRS